MLRPTLSPLQRSLAALSPDVGQANAGFPRPMQAHSPAPFLALWKHAFRTARREGLSAFDAEDVASTALASFLESRVTIVQPYAWIQLVAQRKAWSLRRQTWGRAGILDDHGALVGDLYGQTCPSIEWLLDLEKAVDSLGAVERHAVLAHAVEGNAVDCIARRMGLSEKTVKRRLKQARLSLHLRLSGRSVRSSLGGARA